MLGNKGLIRVDYIRQAVDILSPDLTRQGKHLWLSLPQSGILSSTSAPNWKCFWTWGTTCRTKSWNPSSRLFARWHKKTSHETIQCQKHDFEGPKGRVLYLRLGRFETFKHWLKCLQIQVQWMRDSWHHGDVDVRSWHEPELYHWILWIIEVNEQHMPCLCACRCSPWDCFEFESFWMILICFMCFALLRHRWWRAPRKAPKAFVATEKRCPQRPDEGPKSCNLSTSAGWATQCPEMSEKKHQGFLWVKAIWTMWLVLFWLSF